MKFIDVNYKKWKDQLKNSITTPLSLIDFFQKKISNSNDINYIENSNRGINIDVDTLNKSISKLDNVAAKYPMRITPYYLSLIKSIGDPIWKQAVPDPLELLNKFSDAYLFDDPLHEESQSPVSSIIHRYPDRVIFLVSNQCAMYCRHCMRKRKVGLEGFSKSKSNGLEQGLNYIRDNEMIHDVILSGGDPLLLSTEKLDQLLFKIRQIDHVETIRIHTRVLCTLPHRITENLASVLEKYHPLYINTHFNHPSEITDHAASACSMLAKAGIPLGCQTVLLKGVNDTPEVMIKLMRELIKIRVKPYYLHHPDPIAGTAHFRPSLETGLNIMKAMRGNLTGIAIPQYMIDLPGGYGKVPLLPDYIKYKDLNRAVIENYQGRMCEYWF